MIKAKILTGLQWTTVVVASIFSIDAFLALYKTLHFRDGIESTSDFYAVLAICLAVLAATVLAGVGAMAGILKRRIMFPSLAILSASILLSLGLLLGRSLTLPDWVSLALSSKSESVVACVVLCSLLVIIGKGP
jgi:hypothetical protein